MISYKLDKKAEDFCNMYGTIGILLSATCLLQQMYFMISAITNWIIVCIYIYSIISFSLLVRKNKHAPLLLFIGGFLLFVVAAWLTVIQVYSPILWISMCYSIVISILIIVDGLTKKLEALAASKEAEDNYWLTQNEEYERKL